MCTKVCFNRKWYKYYACFVYRVIQKISDIFPPMSGRLFSTDLCSFVNWLWNFLELSYVLIDYSLCTGSRIFPFDVIFRNCFASNLKYVYGFNHCVIQQFLFKVIPLLFTDKCLSWKLFLDKNWGRSIIMCG